MRRSKIRAPRLLALVLLATPGCAPSSRVAKPTGDGASAPGTSAPARLASPASATPSTPTKPPPSKAAERVAVASESRGTLGPTLAVVARLTRTADALHGSYFYEKTGGSLTLEGSIAGSHVVLDELAGTLKTGSIEGDLAGDGSLTGVWTDAGKKRSLPLHLAPIRLDAAPASALLFKRTRHEIRPVAGSTSKDDVCKVDLEYAEVFGLPAAVEAKINERLAPSPDVLPQGPCDHAVQSTAGYELTHNANGILSVVTSASVSDSQAAHPESGTSQVTVWLETGADVKLFGDVVDPKDAAAVRRQVGAVVDRVTRAAGADADTRALVLDSFGDAPSFVIDKSGVILCASTPHFAANLGGCQYPLAASALRVHGRAAAVWGK